MLGGGSPEVEGQGVLKEVWRAGVTSSMRDFEDMAGWSRAPDESETVDSVGFEETTPGTAVTQLSTWLEAPESGDYVFWISSQGSSKLILSQPDSVRAMARGGLLYIKESIGWPQKGQWDLYADQRCGPWTLEKGRRYLLEIWHAGKPGTKRCELAWSRTAGTSLENFAAGSVPEPGRLAADGRFLADAAGEAANPLDLLGLPADDSPESSVSLFPAGRKLFASPEDALLTTLPGPQWIQRITISQVIRAEKSEREPDVLYKVTAQDEKGAAVAETLFRPEGELMIARFEWELPSLLPVARVLMVRADGTALGEYGQVPLPHTVEAWGPKDGKTVALPRDGVAGAFMSASRKGPADLDGNGLEDQWEDHFAFRSWIGRSVVGKTTDYLSAGADDDGDGLLNQMESLAGRNPFVPDRLGHRLTAEYWRNVPLPDVEGLVRSDAWFGKPNIRVVRWMERSSPLPQNHGLRLRGYITAPETGEYSFWIAARNSGELWISENDTAFEKRRLAWISPYDGAGHGISRTAQDQWDQLPSQRSRPVFLKAGEKYYIEAIAQQGDATAMGQLSLAWQPPRLTRRMLAGEALSTWLAEETDADDDSLPDEWEKAFGLNPADNGLTDRLRQGERGDFDGDGLTNLEEYQHRVDPSNPDSDGDGHRDGDEVHSLRSHPARSDLPSEKTVAVIDPASFADSSLSWNSMEAGLVAADFRGSIEWDFHVDAAGVYGYRFTAAVIGQVLPVEHMCLRLFVDGSPAAAADVAFQGDASTAWRVIGPRLEAGGHRLRLEIDNPLIRRALVLRGLNVFLPEGLDADADGVADWAAEERAVMYGVLPHAAGSAVSPFCLEGTCVATSGGILVNGSPVTALGASRWYADVPLTPEIPGIGTGSGIAVSFPDGTVRRTGVTWTETNVLTDSVIDLRVGDSLLLAARSSAGQTVFADVQVDGEKFRCDGAPVPYRFQRPGVVRVEGRSGTAAGTVTVRVLTAKLPTEIPVVMNENRVVPLGPDSLAAGISLAGTPGLGVEILERGKDGSASVRLLPSSPGSVALTARVGRVDGPILAFSPVASIFVSRVTQQNASQASTYGAPWGFSRVNAPFFVSGLPEGITLEISIARAGVMFLDGSRVVTLRAGDFTNGVAWVSFLIPEGQSGGYCHNVTVYDRDGSVLARR